MENTLKNMNSLQSEEVRTVLNRLYEEARGDRTRFLKLKPRLFIGRLLGKTFYEIIPEDIMKNLYIPVTPEKGELMYLTARTIQAKHVVEFGTSFGISTIFLSAAVRDNGGGTVIGTESIPSKQVRAVANIREAGLGDIVDIRLGNALETLQDVSEPLDLVFLDGSKENYLPVLEMLRPKLRPSAVALADNILSFQEELQPYRDYVQSGRNGFISTTLPLTDGLEYSLYTGI